MIEITLILNVNVAFIFLDHLGMEILETQVTVQAVDWERRRPGPTAQAAALVRHAVDLELRAVVLLMVRAQGVTTGVHVAVAAGDTVAIARILHTIVRVEIHAAISAEETLERRVDIIEEETLERRTAIIEEVDEED